MEYCTECDWFNSPDSCVDPIGPPIAHMEHLSACDSFCKPLENIMNKQEMIEKLKDPKQAQPFGVLSIEERMTLNKAQMANCRVYDESWQPTGGSYFCKNSAYILKPDYEPEPEYVDIDIVVSQWWLRIGNDPAYRDVNNLRTYDAACRPDFVGFFTEFSNYENRMALPDIATRIREGHKVYARFVKETL